MKRLKGFTLIELLIVIAVIAVLVAILVPNFKSMRMEAKESRARGDLKNLQTAIVLYVNRNSSFPASGVNTPSLSVLLNEPTAYRVINDIPDDPFKTTQTYSFLTEGATSPYTDGDLSPDAYYIIFSVGRDETADIVQATLGNVSATDGVISGTDDDVYVTNAKTP